MNTLTLTTLASVLSTRHVALFGPDDLEERLAVADEIVRLARRMDDAELELQGHGWRVVDLVEVGDVTAADEAMAEHARLARLLGQPRHQRDQAAWRAMRAMLDGRFADAEAAIADVFALSERADDPGGLPDRGVEVRHAGAHQRVRVGRVRLPRRSGEDEEVRVAPAGRQPRSRRQSLHHWSYPSAWLHGRAMI